MSVLPAGDSPARQISALSHNSKAKIQPDLGDTAREKEGLAYEKEVPTIGGDDAGDVMAALEKQEKALFPEGGKHAWLTVLGTFCCTMVTFGVLNTYGVSTVHRRCVTLYQLAKSFRYIKPISSRHTWRTIQISLSTGSARCSMLASSVWVCRWVSLFFALRFSGPA